MGQSVLDRIKGLVNRNKPSNMLVLHKRLKGQDWYIGEKLYKYMMVTDMSDVVNLNLRGKTDGMSKDEWLKYANSHFANGWCLMKLDKSGDEII